MIARFLILFLRPHTAQRIAARERRHPRRILHGQPCLIRRTGFSGAAVDLHLRSSRPVRNLQLDCEQRSFRRCDLQGDFAGLRIFGLLVDRHSAGTAFAMPEHQPQHHMAMAPGIPGAAAIGRAVLQPLCLRPRESCMKRVEIYGVNILRIHRLSVTICHTYIWLLWMLIPDSPQIVEI